MFQSRFRVSFIRKFSDKDRYDATFSFNPVSGFHLLESMNNLRDSLRGFGFNPVSGFHLLESPD